MYLGRSSIVLAVALATVAASAAGQIGGGITRQDPRRVQAKPTVVARPRPVSGMARNVAGLERAGGVLPFQFDPPSTTTLVFLYKGGVDAVERPVADIKLDLLSVPELLDFKFETKDKGVARMLVQVSSAPFTAGLTDWQHPLGLIDAGANGEVLPSGIGRVSLPIRLYNQTLYLGTVPKTTWGKPKAAFDRDAPPLLIDAPLFRGRYASYRGVMATAPARLPAFSSVPSTGDYFVRVIPLSANGTPVGGPSNQVAVHAFAPPRIDLPMATTSLPGVTLLRYDPMNLGVRSPLRRVIVIRNPFQAFIDRARQPTVPGSQAGHQNDDAKRLERQMADRLEREYAPGSRVTLPEPEDGFWDEFASAVGQIWEMLSDAVNWVSRAYAAIQEKALDLGCAVLGPDARTVLRVAMAAGMTSLGIPPTLPNFDQLISDGKGYLAASLADQVPGLTPDLARTIIDFTVEQAAAARRGAMDPNLWCRPDPDARYRPAVVTVSLGNTGALPTSPTWLYLNVFTGNTSLFLPAKILVPPIPPRSNITIRVNLNEATDDINAASWLAAYTAPRQMTIRWTLDVRVRPGEAVTYKPAMKDGSIPALTGTIAAQLGVPPAGTVALW